MITYVKLLVNLVRAHLSTCKYYIFPRDGALVIKSIWKCGTKTTDALGHEAVGQFVPIDGLIFQ
jgi:hypothetical protein